MIASAVWCLCLLLLVRRLSAFAFADIGEAKGEISDAEIEATKCASGKTLWEFFEDILGADIPDWMKIQPEYEHGNIGVGVNVRRCILLSHEGWLGAARAGRIAAGRAEAFDHARLDTTHFFIYFNHMWAGMEVAKASTLQHTKNTS
jgi:hypothetical protein